MSGQAGSQGRSIPRTRPDFAAPFFLFRSSCSGPALSLDLVPHHSSGHNQDKALTAFDLGHFGKLFDDLGCLGLTTTPEPRPSPNGMRQQASGSGVPQSAQGIYPGSSGFDQKESSVSNRLPGKLLPIPDRPSPFLLRSGLLRLAPAGLAHARFYSARARERRGGGLVPV